MYPEKGNIDDEWYYGAVNGSGSEKFLFEGNLNERRLIDSKSELQILKVPQRNIQAEETYY